jgi:hypothetical protein
VLSTVAGQEEPIVPQPPPGPIQPLDESSDEIAALTDDDLRVLRAEKAAEQARRTAAPSPPRPDPAEDPAGGNSGPVSEDDILGALDDASRKNVPRVYKPGETGDSRLGKAVGPLGSKEYEAYQLKMKAISSGIDKLDEKSSTLADKPARVGMMFVFTSARGAEAAWAKLGEDLRKYSTKQVKEVSGVAQVNIGTMLPPRRTLELIRTLKAAGGIFRTYKAEANEVQKWLTEHLK